MNLLLDIGNSTIAWGVEEKNSIVQSGILKYDRHNFIIRLEEGIHLSVMPTVILLSCVTNDRMICALREWADEKWNIDIWQATVERRFKQLENGYLEVRQMGVDRWLAMIAAWEKHRKALCIVDCGTAVTVDIVNESGKHLGGYIIPGLEMMQQALIKNTDRIKVSVSDSVKIVCGNDTQQAVTNGASVAIIAMIDRAVEFYEQQLNNSLACIITGGMAGKIKVLLNASFELEKNLVLQGLSLMYRSKK